jgi:hypothetical protein
VAGERIRLSQTPDGHGVVIDALCQDLSNGGVISLSTTPVEIWVSCNTYYELSLGWSNTNTIGLYATYKRDV